MKWTWTSTGVVMLFATAAFGADGDVSLVQDGRATSVIVVADRPTSVARRAASELQTWIRKASGAIVEILPEDKAEQAAGQRVILVGDTKRTASLGIRSDKFELEEIRIRTFADALVLIGDDARPDGIPLSGTLWAVETFAERYLGVRVLWPGELGEVVPQRTTVRVGKIDDRYVPPLRRRGIRNTGYNSRVQRGLDALGWKTEDFKEHWQESEQWFRFHRIGGSYLGRYGHAFDDYWARFHKDHPEWFALQPDGTRDNSPADGGHRARLCVSNRGLIEQVARDRIIEARKRPKWDTVSVSPNDGGRAAFCQCEACKAWDAPGGKVIESWGPKGPVEHVSLTDRYVKFYSAVAEIFAKELPDRYLGAYAYSAYTLPPVEAKLHPNVVIGFVEFSYLNEAIRAESRDSWLKWSQAAGHLFLRPNALTAGMGFPTVYAHRLGEDLRFCADHGMLVTDFDCCYHHWATNGINYYVLARLLWDPEADVDAIVKDYCQSGFGPAAEPVEAYFRKLETMTAELARGNAYQGRKQSPDVLAACYTDEFLDACGSLLDEADRRAGGDEVIRQRIAFLRKAIEYARIRRDWTPLRLAAWKGDVEAAKRLKVIEAKRDDWYQELGISWALNAAYLRFYGY